MIWYNDHGENNRHGNTSYQIEISFSIWSNNLNKKIEQIKRD